MKTFMTALRMIVVMTIVTGVVYPLAMLGIAQTLFPDSANGSLIRNGGTVIGSELIGQQFADERYFWGRPSAVGYNPLPSGGSNAGATSKALQDQIAERRARLVESHSGNQPPDDLLLASGSGLDPHISPEAATYQIERVATSRQLDPVQTESLRRLVAVSIEPQSLGFIGQPRVNVLKLNLALDSLFNAH